MSQQKIYGLHRKTHTYLIEPVTGTRHIIFNIDKRFINFTNNISSSKKSSTKEILVCIKNDCQSTTCRNHDLLYTVYKAPCRNHELLYTVYKAPCRNHELLYTVYKAPCCNLPMLHFGKDRIEDLDIDVTDGLNV